MLSDRTCPNQKSGRGIQYPFDIGVLERQSRSLRHLRRLQHHRGIRVDPAGVLAESQEPAEVLQALYCGECGVRPAIAKRAKRVHVKLLEEVRPFPLQKGRSLPSRSSRRLRIVVSARCRAVASSKYRSTACSTSGGRA